MRTLNKIQIALLALVVIVTIPFSAYAVDGQRKISQTPSTTFPIVINQPGSYVLTSNLVVTDPNVNAIEITDSHITLDLNGHMIRGPNLEGGTGNGIYSLNSYNISIKNGSIWGFRGFEVGGVSLLATSAQYEAGHCVEGIQAFLNGNGIRIYAGLITNCTANNNEYIGIDAQSSTITNCTANENRTHGIWANYCTITDCTAVNNENLGIHTVSSNVTSCMASNNNGVGFNVVYSTITNCTAIDNDLVGIGANSSTVTNCTASNNGTDGVGVLYSSRIEGNTLNQNGKSGTGYGLNIEGDNNYAVKNAASNNSSGNFQNIGSNNVLPFTGDNANYWAP
jgi:parallel beta-helix repeat protein